MAITSISNNNQQTKKFGRLCLGGVSTGVSMYAFASLFEVLSNGTSKAETEILHSVKNAGKIGACISALTFLGTVIYANA